MVKLLLVLAGCLIVIGVLVGVLTLIDLVFPEDEDEA